MANFRVTSAEDSGSGTLRQAILDANAAPGVDSITIARPLKGATIDLQSDLPAITESLNAFGNGRAVNDGNGFDVFDFTADDSGFTVADIAIINARAAIDINGDSNSRKDGGINISNASIEGGDVGIDVGSDDNHVIVKTTSLFDTSGDGSIDINGDDTTLKLFDVIIDRNGRLTMKVSRSMEIVRTSKSCLQYCAVIRHRFRALSTATTETTPN